MPGLEQLKKFSTDMTSVGNEGTVRASRGEPYVSIPIPSDAQDMDDSDDFILGMPIEQTSPENEQKGESSTDNASSDIDNSLESDEDIFADLGLKKDDIPNIPQESTSDIIQENSENPVIPNLDDLQINLPDEQPDLDALNDFVAEDNSEPIPQDDTQVQEDNKTTEETQEPTQENTSTDDFSNNPFEDIDDNSIIDMQPEEDFEETPPVPEFEKVVPNPIASSSSDTKADGDDLEELEELDDIDSENAPSNEKPETEVQDNIIPEGEPEPLESLEEVEDLSSLDEPEVADLETIPTDNEENAQSDVLSDIDTSSDAEISNEPDTNEFDVSKLDLPDFDNPATDSPIEEINDLDNTAPINEQSDIELDDQAGNEINSSDILSEIENTDIDTAMADFNSESTGEANNDTSSDIDSLDSLPDIDSLDDFNTTDEALASPDSDGEFVIPGISDVDSDFEFDFKPKDENHPESSSVSDSIEKRTSLTDDEYKRFQQALHDFPLNLRLEIEALIVNNEFKDDAVFALIDKILSGSSARQVATYITKYLDIAIDVPRDFERRTATQYEAYKQSIEYQLKNRIVPFAFVGIVLFFAVWLIIFLTGKYIYRPMMAEQLYKEGYELLDNDLYPQSEEKFNEAVSYKPKKKWFFRYARSYADKKQYDRSRRMYSNILLRFQHDKQAGMEYANMELYDLMNFSKAEEIVKRDILDYHINDPDAMLLLGDVYLEWATEKDPEKFEQALIHYDDVIKMYGVTDEYTKRMMRYYIRTDNLREVLPLKAYFYGKKKNILGSNDLTELSEYLLNKLYGYLPPSDEYLRTQIENVRQLLERAIEADRTVPEPYYNLARYFRNTSNDDSAKALLENSLPLFEQATTRKPSRIQKNIDAYRLLGEIYSDQQEYLKAEETYGQGINLFETEQENSFLQSTKEIGNLYADMGDIDYFISGLTDVALMNYQKAVQNKYNTPSVQYKIGCIEYASKNYDQALSAFIDAAKVKYEDKNLLFALGNVLCLRNDDYASQGYFERLIEQLDLERSRAGILLPQIQSQDGELVDLYMKASNNLGVVLHRLANRTGDSELNGQAMVQLSESLRAWDALTRNQTTMVRLEGSNLAAQNMKYISQPYSNFEPSIYTSIPRVLDGEIVLEQSFIKNK